LTCGRRRSAVTGSTASAIAAVHIPLPAALSGARLDPSVDCGNRSGEPDRESLDYEIARLRGLDVGQLRARWRTVFRRRAPPHLPRHLLFRILAYRLQADRLGELDADSQRLLGRIALGTSGAGDQLMAHLTRSTLRPGTLLTREWQGHLQQVMVLADGFAWNGNTYPSLTKVAFAITGARWNGPRFFAYAIGRDFDEFRRHLEN
jgi:hypothetical protein